MVLNQNSGINNDNIVYVNKYRIAISKMIYGARKIIDTCEFYRVEKLFLEKIILEEINPEILEIEENMTISYSSKKEDYQEKKSRIIDKDFLEIKSISNENAKKIMFGFFKNDLIGKNPFQLNKAQFSLVKNDIETKLEKYIQDFNEEFKEYIKNEIIEKIEFSLLSEEIEKIVNSVSMRAFELVA